MKIGTAGNKIYEPISNCDCGLTGGCEKCNIVPSFIGCLSDEEANEMRKGIEKFKKRFNDAFAKKHKILFGE